MSYLKAKRQSLSDKKALFSWGYVDNIPSIDLSPECSPYLRNVRLDGTGAIIRPWRTLHASLTAGTTPKGIGSYLRATPANDVMVVRHNQDATHKIVTVTEWGTVNPIDTTWLIASNNKMNFLNTWDVIYCMNGSDNLGMLSGTTYSTPSTWVSNFAPSFGVMFNGSHFASGRSSNPSTVYKSVGWLPTAPNNLHDFNSTGSDKLTFAESITGLCSANQALFYFTKNTVSVTGTGDITNTAGTYSYSTRQLTTAEGGYNHECIVSVGNNVWYLSSALQINRIATGQNINGFEVMNLTQRPYRGCTKLMESIDRDQTWSRGEYLYQPSIIKRHLKSQGATFPDIVLVYDTIKDVFLVDGQNYMNDWVDFHQKHFTVSAVEPKVYQDEYGQDDEDSAIPFEYWTKEFYFSDPSFKKILRETRLILDINELAELKQEIYIDGVLKDTKIVDKDNIPVTQTVGWGIGTTPIAEHTIGEDMEISDNPVSAEDDYKEVYLMRTKGNLNYKGRKIQFRYSCSTLAAKVRLKNMMIKLEVLPPEASELTI